MTAIFWILYNFIDTHSFAFKMFLFVKTLIGRTYTVEIDYNSTIGELRQAIFDKYNIPQSLQMLLFAGKLLTNDQATFFDWNIRRDSGMHMLNLPAAKYSHKIIFENKDKKELTVILNSSNLIEDIKFQIQDKTGIPFESIRVFYNDRELSDEEALIESKIIPVNYTYRL